MIGAKYETLTVAVSDRTSTITLNQPDRLNVVDGRSHRELSLVFREVAANEDVDVVVLTGAGRAFCAGGDIAWLQTMVADPDRFLGIIEEAKGIVLSMLEMPKPMICRMNGDAVGLGATLALCCDAIVAKDTARFGDPHVRVGLVAGDGAAVLLPQAVGYMRAKELLLTGDLLTAHEAQQIGIINHVVPEAELDARVAGLVRKLAGGARRAIRYTKIAMNAGLRKLATEQMDMLMAYEAISARSRDHAEAVVAMNEKRRPQFSGD